MNINFNENNDKRTDEHGTFVDKPVRPRLSDLDFVTWADMIDWGEFNLRLNSLTPNAQVTNSYESFINALKVNFDFLYQKIVELGGGDSTPEVTYTVKLNVTNGSKNPNNSQDVVSGGSVSWTVTPNSGYSMPSSVSGATISGNIVTVSNVTASKTINLTCVQNAQPIIQYTVEFNTNGGSGSVNSRTCTAGTSITLPTYSGTKSGYSFAGWCENPDGTGDTYSVGSAYYPNGNIELFAKWEEEVTPGGSLYYYVGIDPVTQSTVPGNNDDWVQLSGTQYTSIEPGEMVYSSRVNWVIAVPTTLGLNNISNGETVTDLYDVSTVTCADGVEYKVFVQIDATKKIDISIVQ